MAIVVIWLAVLAMSMPVTFACTAIACIAVLLVVAISQ